SLADGAVAQLTDHNYWSDSEPVYLPSGGIVFSSDRSAHSPSCDFPINDLSDLNLHSLTPDRKTVRRFLNHKDIDMHPRVLNDGRVAYLRWEYQERTVLQVHSVWTARPDGSGADSLVKQHLSYPYGVRLASSLGETSQRLIAVATGHHTIPQGPLVLLDPAAGANSTDAIQVLTRGIRVNEGYLPGQTVPEGGRLESDGFYTDPFALNEQSFLASFAFLSPTARRGSRDRGDVDSNGYGVYLVDVFGNKELLFRDPWKGAYNAFPLRPRRKPTAIAETADRSANHAVCTIANVYEGMDGVAPGTIRHIRIAEALPWPIVPGEGVKRWGTGVTENDKDATRWCPVRVIGTVPVEADGSAHFKVPVADNASVYFQALDENYMEIRRMRSSVSFAPGEIRSCTGCHETRPAAVVTANRATGRALTRAASEPAPPAWGARTPIHFPRDVQPVLTKNCAGCHSGATAKAGLDFSEGKAFRTIRDKNLVAISNVKMDASITQVKQFGSHSSRLTRAIREQKKMQVSLTPDEWLALVTWVDANIPFTGEMFHVRTADGRRNVWAPYEWPAPWGSPTESAALGERIPKGLK
ncbi:MAG: hypothetical protein LBV28_05765, partial [Puniceicoccales bacterium]|nr:hypothetical protein [Puniceicoccales bacterium]